MALALRAFGIAREQRVLLILTDTPAFPVAFFGVMRIGAVPVPINPLYKASDYRFFLEDSYARVVITETSCLDKLSQALDGYDGAVSVFLADGRLTERHQQLCRTPIRWPSYSPLTAGNCHPQYPP
jgi:benzoate-CoA ligase